MAKDELILEIKAEVEGVNAEIERVKAALQDLQTEVQKLNNTFNTLSSTIKSALAGIASYLTLDAFKDSVMTMEQLRMQFKYLYGDAELAEEKLQSLKNIAISAGADIKSLAEIWTKLAVVGIKPTNEQLEAAIKGMYTLGLSTDGVKGAFEALAQMAAKGFVSMEELRQQLADRFPKAIEIISEQMGISTDELYRRVSEGTIKVQEVINAFFEGMQKEFGKVDISSTLQAQFNQLKTAVMELFDALGQAGLLEIFKDAVTALTGILRQIAPVLKEVVSVVKEFYNILKDVGVIDAVAFVFSKLLDIFKAVGLAIQDITTRARAFWATLTGDINKAVEYEKRLEEISKKLDDVGKSLFSLSSAQQETKRTTTELAEGLKTTADIAKQTATATEFSKQQAEEFKIKLQELRNALQDNVARLKEYESKLRDIAEAQKKLAEISATMQTSIAIELARRELEVYDERIRKIRESYESEREYLNRLLQARREAGQDTTDIQERLKRVEEGYRREIEIVERAKREEIERIKALERELAREQAEIKKQQLELQLRLAQEGLADVGEVMKAFSSLTAKDFVALFDTDAINAFRSYAEQVKRVIDTMNAQAQEGFKNTQTEIASLQQQLQALQNSIPELEIKAKADTAELERKIEDIITKYDGRRITVYMDLVETIRPSWEG